MSSGIDGEWVFTAEMLQQKQLAKIFATGPEDPMNNRHNFYSKFYHVNVSMRARGIWEIKKN